MNDNTPETDNSDDLTDTKSRTKKPYRTPSLQKFGNIREVTLGGSPGLGDSGFPTVFRPPGT